MSHAVRFLHALAHALATMALYSPGHPAGRRAQDLALEALRALLAADSQPTFLFLGGPPIYAGRALHELGDWPWASRFTAISVQRLQFDPGITPESFGAMLDEIQARLVGSHSAELGEVQAVVVDPGSPHELVIGPAEFPEWKALADAVDIEQVWKRLQTGSEDEDDMSRAAHYPAYQLVVAKGEQGNFIFCDVANDDGQGYVALFTHADALALGRGEIEEIFLSHDPRVALVSGAEIFPTLAHEPSAGIVLNFNGPTEPMVFGHGVLDLLCAELASPP